MPQYTILLPITALLFCKAGKDEVGSMQTEEEVFKRKKFPGLCLPDSDYLTIEKVRRLLSHTCSLCIGRLLLEKCLQCFYKGNFLCLCTLFTVVLKRCTFILKSLCAINEDSNFKSYQNFVFHQSFFGRHLDTFLL